MRKRLKFKAHFNRVNMVRKNPNVWTVHNSIGCFQVTDIDIRVPVKTVYKPEAKQPRAYFTGYAHVEIKGTTAVLY